MYDLERRRGLRLGHAIEDAAHHDLDLLAFSQRPARDLHARAIDVHAAEVDHDARFTSRQTFDVARQDLIEPQARILGGRRECGLRGCH